ncbi:MAG: glycosyltransferase, partial [Spirochaetes bacterium]|nr:glycosyltransferase [Spirochaetota bacterium]
MHEPGAILMEPPSPHATTGGYRFNAQLAGALPELRRVTATPHRLQEVLSRTLTNDGESRTPVLVDSLYLRRRESCGALRRLKRAGFPLILLAHLLASQERSEARRVTPEARRERNTLAVFDGAIAPSEFMARELSARGMPRGSTVVVHPASLGGHGNGSPAGGGPSAAEGPPRGPAEPDRERRDVAQFLTVANVTPVKHLHSALPALATLREHAWQWEIIGQRTNSRYVSRVRRIASAYGVAGRIRFRGARSPDQVREAMRRATALLVTSRFESFGLVAYDAAQEGVPTVGWRVGGVPEAVASLPSPSASLPALNDSDGLARALRS